jgi:hypothetical protein
MLDPRPEPMWVEAVGQKRDRAHRPRVPGIPLAILPTTVLGSPADFHRRGTKADADRHPDPADHAASRDTWLATAESLRRGLAVALVVIGVLLTLWILVQLGPVAYGLPAPLFRRSPLGA